MVIVGTSAETAPTVPKDNATVGRRIDAVVATTAVSLRLVDRNAPAVRIMVPVSGAIATTAATTTAETAPTTAVDTRAVTTDGTIAVVSAGPTIAGRSKGGAMIAGAEADRGAAAVKADSGRDAVAKPSDSSVATRDPMSRTFRTRSRRRSSIPRFAATC